jgi:hypothetical protein
MAMSEPLAPSRVAVSAALSPLERGCEIVFGILMAVSVTAAAEIRSGGLASVRELFIAALGCNVAWGLIDGVIYLLQQQFSRFRNRRTLLELRHTDSEDTFRKRVMEELPPLVGPALTNDTYARLRQVVQSHSAEPAPFWSGGELLAALTICALVTASTFPMVLPFILLDDARLALRVSHGVAVAMLFLLGWWIGRWAGASAIRSGLLLATVGSVMAVACVALGG